MTQSLARPSLHDLRANYPEHVDKLQRRRAGEMHDSYIDGYVHAGWLDLHGGLWLTPTGTTLCVALSAQLLPLGEFD